MTVPKKSYKPSLEEDRAAEMYFERRKRKPPLPSVNAKIVDGVAEVSVDHPDQEVGFTMLNAATGSSDGAFLNGLIAQVLNASRSSGEINQHNVNFMFSVVADIEPQDQLEAMLATQMAAIHMATMTFANRLASVENIPQQDSAEKALNKLARTFATQMEALKRYRNGGEQKMTVEHVTVNEGGQAIVGNVSNGGGGRTKNPKATP
jgi:hypothetical protein